MRSVVAFGEVLWDVPRGGEPVLGGAPANFLCQLAQRGVDCNLVSSVGNDERGRAALRTLASFGVGLNGVTVGKLPTGFVDVDLQGAEPSYTITEGVAYDTIALSERGAQVVSQASLIYFGTLAARSPESSRTLDRILALSEAPRFVDLNLRGVHSVKSAVDRALREATVLKVNEDELRILGETRRPRVGSTDRDIADQILHDHPKMQVLVITRGAAGARCLSRSKGWIESSGYSVSLRDTIGAGDAFSAGFVSEFIRGAPLERALQKGNLLGALVASKRGGICLVEDYEISALESKAREQERGIFRA